MNQNRWGSKADGSGEGTVRRDAVSPELETLIAAGIAKGMAQILRALGLPSTLAGEPVSPNSGYTLAQLREHTGHVSLTGPLEREPLRYPTVPRIERPLPPGPDGSERMWVAGDSGLETATLVGPPEWETPPGTDLSIGPCHECRKGDDPPDPGCGFCDGTGYFQEHGLQHEGTPELDTPHWLHCTNRLCPKYGVSQYANNFPPDAEQSEQSETGRLRCSSCPPEEGGPAA